MDSIINYWNQQPCNIKHSSCEVGTKEYFDEVEKRKYFVESHIPGSRISINGAEKGSWKSDVESARTR